MKVSYSVLKKYIPDIPSPEQVAEDLIMHTAEVEEIISQKDAFKNIVFGNITSVNAHPDADSLKVCMVDVGEKDDIQIVCGGSNLENGQGVAVAKIGASVLWHGQGDPVIMKKTKIRGVESYGMICASEEIGLKEDFPAKDEKEILDISHITASPGINLAKVLGKDDIILEIDNKAINHRPDLFSHIGIAREIAAIHGNTLPYILTEQDFSHLPELGIQNYIPEAVKRYIGLKVSGVSNIPAPEYVKEVLKSHDIESKGMLVDITNYSLYLYGQPTHCFDADKLSGNIHIRFAKQGESFLALNDKEYILKESDIVIADDAGVIALGGIIGGKNTAVSETTKNIIIESAWFDQSVIRHTGKRIGLRTDALNVFEKDLVHSLSHIGASLIVKELSEHFPDSMKLEAISDIYPHPSAQTTIEFNPEYIRNLLGKNYEDSQMLDILACVGIEKDGNMLLIPKWRKDISHLADIAEEVARLDGYNNIESTVPRIQLGAVSQYPIYQAKRDIRNFLSARGYYDMYTYSFVDDALMKKALGSTEDFIPLKNALTEDMTHMRGSLIPNLLNALSENRRQYSDMQLFECEKVFRLENGNIDEHYELSIVRETQSENLFYDMRNLLSLLFGKLAVLNYNCKKSDTTPHYAHAGRTASIVVRGKEVGYVGEIHPKVSNNFDIPTRVGFISLNLTQIEAALYGLTQAQEISQFQENNFDVNFVIEKSLPGEKILTAIKKSDPLIQKVELFDIYENEEKLPNQRSLSFTVYIQSMDGTLDDSIKNEVIEKIVKNVEKIGGKLR